jgi:hypothetical protein
MGAGRILLPAFQGPPSAVHGYIVERSMPVFERLSSELRKADTKEEAKQWLDKTDALLKQARERIKQKKKELSARSCAAATGVAGMT